MSAESSLLSIAQHGHFITTDSLKKTGVVPFKDHSQFSLLVDTFIRKESHHALLVTPFSARCRTIFLQTFLMHLDQETTPLLLRQSRLLTVDIEQLFHSKKQLTDHEFDELHEFLNAQPCYLIIAITHFDLLLKENHQIRFHFLRTQFERLIAHPKCRFLLFTPQKNMQPILLNEQTILPLTLAPLTEANTLGILKLQRCDLEQFHNVVIPDEVLNQAYALSNRFLSTENVLENALLLLDSAAARAHAETAPTLTLTLLLQTLSSWTHIPSSHLQFNQFKLNDFLHVIRERVYGQEPALNLIGEALQKSHVRLVQQTGVFCHLTFVGPEHSGKKTTAQSLVDFLFKQLGTLYFADLTTHLHHLSEVKLKRCPDNHYVLLDSVLKEKPFAVIYFEINEKTSIELLEQLNEIIHTGRLENAHGQEYQFYQTTIIISTTLGSDVLSEYASHLKPSDDKLVDLFQLIAKETENAINAINIEQITDELMQALRPRLEKILPHGLCQHIIPFLPLQKEILQKIIQQKLSFLSKQLQHHYTVELTYAPEILKYLAALPSLSVDNTLKQLYFCVEQALSQHQAMKTQSNQLFLQLNETGDMLRCDWISEPFTAASPV